MVNARRLEGMQQFNRAAMEDAGAPIGFAPQQVGKEGVSELQGAISGAYDNATAGVNVPLDETFDPNIIRNAGSRLPP
ncbi:hypothetical protein [Croceicoccus sp. Ery15]|uniref:hypothetical protein n=1 Tax=Croceicoccus sp. Ery15 TaxID=1703338 RepID=UPI001E3A66CF|nr:hypothetical protein [Croceicoccus sp. Ery15]